MVSAAAPPTSAMSMETCARPSNETSSYISPTTKSITGIRFVAALDESFPCISRDGWGRKGPVSRIPLGDFSSLSLLFLGMVSRRLRHRAKSCEQSSQRPSGPALVYNENLEVVAPGSLLYQVTPRGGCSVGRRI